MTLRSLRNRWLPILALLLLFAVGLGLAFATEERQKTPHATGRVLVVGSANTSELETAADYFEAGNNEFDQKHYQNAIADYDQAIVLNPDYAEAYNNRAYTNMILENYAPALKDLDQAIALRPNYVRALMNRGDIYNYYYAIDRDKAMANYDRVLALNPSNTSICGHRLLAQHHGWNLGTLADLLLNGTQAGCQNYSSP